MSAALSLKKNADSSCSATSSNENAIADTEDIRHQFLEVPFLVDVFSNGPLHTGKVALFSLGLVERICIGC